MPPRARASVPASSPWKMAGACAFSSAAAKWQTSERQAIMTRLVEHYSKKVVPELMKKFGYTNPMQAPRINKITLNMGVGEAMADKKVIENAVSAMRKICGQKPLITLARKSIANFKARENWPIGCKVTLRRAHMYEFLDRFISI